MQETNILDRLKLVLDESDSFGPVSDERIAAAERALGVVFPASYRTFLRMFGASFIIAHDLAGLPDEPKSGETPMWSDVILVNRQTQRVSRGHIPSTLIDITNDGCDDTYYLDTSVLDSEGECPVVVLGPGRDCEVVAPSFVDFIEKVAANRMMP